MAERRLASRAQASDAKDLGSPRRHTAWDMDQDLSQRLRYRDYLGAGLSLSSTRGRGSKARPKDGVIHVEGCFDYTLETIYTFARIGAVVNLKVQDYYPSGKRFFLRFKEKGGKEKELPYTTSWRSSWTSTSKRPVSATSQALFCSRPPWAKPGSYRAVR